MTLGIKPRKPRGPGRGRGGKRGMGTGRVGRPPGRVSFCIVQYIILVV